MSAAAAPIRARLPVPTVRLALALAAVLPAALAAVSLPFAAIGLVFVDLVAIGIALAEAARVGRRLPMASRGHDARLVVGQENEVVVRLHNPTSSPLRVTVRDDLPDGWSADPAEVSVELPPYARREAKYRTRPPVRGEHRFGDLHLRVEGGARLVAVQARVPSAALAKVYPNLVAPRRFDLAARLGSLVHHGFRAIRRDGRGGEFEKLREYVPGDDYGDIDWKATAKRKKPTTRVYQQERSQTVVVCIDAGRMMAARLGRLTKLDHAIDAGLLTAYAALRQGDRVGAAVFSDDVTTWVPPRPGIEQYRRILDALYDAEASLTFVDFRRLVEVLRVRLPRRALVVVLTDLLDEAHAMPLAEHAGLLAARHLPICVTMKDDVVAALAARTPATADEAFDRVAASDLLAEQSQVKSHLRKHGVSLVEAPPGEIAVATVNRYLELKRRGRPVSRRALDVNRFVHERTPVWRELEDLLVLLERQGFRALGLERARRFGKLYKSASSDLIRARGETADAAVVDYLNDLVARAYAIVYGGRGRRERVIAAFYLRGFPRLVREERRAVLLSAAILVLGAAIGAGTVALDRDAEAVMIPGMHRERTPEERVAEEEAETQGAGAGEAASFSGFLFTHNFEVSFMVFALGVTFGIGTVLLLFYNGVPLGALAVQYHLSGRGLFFWAWILPHGIPELTAVVIAGASGLVLARALWSPGRLGRGAALRAAAKRAVLLCLGIAPILALAGLVEGTLSQIHAPRIPYEAKLAAAAAIGIALYAYLLLAGRSEKTA
jgi:uncharacterized protein (DUF58 family)/uncharacterized membrane protein SpoIIM required for sporulation